MKLGTQDLTYVKTLVGVFEEGWDHKFGKMFLFTLFVLGWPMIAGLTYYYNSTLGGLGIFFLIASLFSIWLYRIIYRVEPLPLEFRAHEIVQPFNNGKTIIVNKDELTSVLIKRVRGGYVMILNTEIESNEIFMNQKLRMEFLRNA